MTPERAAELRLWLENSGRLDALHTPAVAAQLAYILISGAKQPNTNGETEGAAA